MRWLIQKIADLNIVATTLAWVGFAAGLFLLVPTAYLPVKIDAHMLLFAWGGVFIAVSYFLGRLFVRAWKVIEARWQKRLAQQNIESLIRCLDHTERAILREFVIRRTSVLHLPVKEPAVANLLHNGVLEMNEPQQLLDQLDRVDCMISLAARPLLSYRTLSLPVGNLTGEQLDKLKKLRPIFLQPDYEANRTYSGKVFRIKTSNQSDSDAPMHMDHPPMAS
ncbi:super-infection exclusion protein B [Celerinatantimonas yamalensis]|uniref:Super-infection exclusion protein B n=1 Tax=Celerinatantimonas yamalensis TaxID=559956 RepID=A0ABW9G5H7_9GAMM